MAGEIMLKKALELATKTEKLNPNEKLLKEASVFETRPGVEKASFTETDIVLLKNAEIEAAKNYFAGIGDTEKLNILEGANELKRAEALAEASEKSPECFERSREVKKLEDKNEVLENVQIDRFLNQKSDVSFGGLGQERWMLTGNRCKRGGFVAGGA